MLTPAAFRELLARKGVLVLDGGLATELETRGIDISGPLWSARALRENPQAIEDLHLAWLEAGADVLVTAGYQCSFEGMRAAGADDAETEELLRRSVELAKNAVRRYRGGSRTGGLPLVAASVGPYGAARHDGSEYRGDYGLSLEALADFHRRRMAVLALANPDLLACETIPGRLEAEAMLAVLRETPRVSAWFSFSCRDGASTCAGDPIADCAALLDQEPQVLAVGVNCTAPDHVESLIREIRLACGKPVVVYPNSGERWNPATRCWTGEGDPLDFARQAKAWRRAGASLIGGCCRTGPAHIRALRASLTNTERS